jgi:hypothetical protein
MEQCEGHCHPYDEWLQLSHEYESWNEIQERMLSLEQMHTVFGVVWHIGRVKEKKR